MSVSMEVALAGIESITASFTEPDDDYAAVCFMEMKDGQHVTLPIWEFMDNDRTKEMLADLVLPDLIRTAEAKSVVLVLSAWAVQKDKRDGYETNDEPRPAEHPDRFEILTVIEMTAEGVVEDKQAYINRDPFGIEPPTLSEFIDLPVNATSGLFVDAIVAALKGVKNHDQ